MLVKTTSKMDAAKALANTLLKMDKRQYCSQCGNYFNPNEFPCCEDPIIGDHVFFCSEIIKANKETLKNQRNQFGSTKGHTMRWGLCIPEKFFRDLCKAFKKIYGVDLLDKESKGKDLRDFMRKFPYFRVCERV